LQDSETCRIPQIRRHTAHLRTRHLIAQLVERLIDVRLLAARDNNRRSSAGQAQCNGVTRCHAWNQ
jgi:hypothetical protein